MQTHSHGLGGLPNLSVGAPAASLRLPFFAKKGPVRLIHVLSCTLLCFKVFSALVVCGSGKVDGPTVTAPNLSQSKSTATQRSLCQEPQHVSYDMLH